MTDNHSYSFFGQATGIILQSGLKEDPYLFLRCIKKKGDKNWEKPSLGEGKTIRCSLEELIMISKVLNKESNSWSSYHKYKNENTQISFNWEGNDWKKLWINIGKYSKMLGVAQVEIFRLLLKHIINEKVEFATGVKLPKPQSSKNYSSNPKNQTPTKNHPKEGALNSTVAKTSIINVQDSGAQKIAITCSIKSETGKALLLIFNHGQEIWIPKSTIYSKYKTELGVTQEFLMDEWILKRNKILV